MDFWDCLVILGAALIVGGLAIIHYPTAIIVGGLITLAFGVIGARWG